MGDHYEDNEDMNEERRALRNAKSKNKDPLIKAFSKLRKLTPSLRDRKSGIGKRQQILMGAIDYILNIKHENIRLLLNVRHLTRTNSIFEAEIKRLNALVATYANKSSELALCVSETDDSDASN